MSRFCPVADLRRQMFMCALSPCSPNLPVLPHGRGQSGGVAVVACRRLRQCQALAKAPNTSFVFSLAVSFVSLIVLVRTTGPIRSCYFQPKFWQFVPQHIAVRPVGSDDRGNDSQIIV